jgi:Fis family transcriptional regulator
MDFPTIEATVRYRLGLYLDALDDAPPRDVLSMVVGAIERPVIDMMLEHAGGNQALAAEYLGISRPTLRAKIKSGLARRGEQDERTKGIRRGKVPQG